MQDSLLLKSKKKKLPPLLRQPPANAQALCALRCEQCPCCAVHKEARSAYGFIALRDSAGQMAAAISIRKNAA